MSPRYKFEQVARLPMYGDNAAIALKNLGAGTNIDYNGKILTLDYDVLEGHRFAVRKINNGEYLLSWRVPYGKATEDILPGAWLRNSKIIDCLSSLKPDFPELTDNFIDEIPEFKLEDITKSDTTIQANSIANSHSGIGYWFSGYKRKGRGTGTRNYLAVMGTTAKSAGWAEELVRRHKHLADDYKNIDGIIAVTHTEGVNPNNQELVLRTLAGFVAHPNVGAIIIADYGSDLITKDKLEHYMRQNKYLLDDIPHCFLTIREFESSLEQAKKSMVSLLKKANVKGRDKAAISELNIALQCGGSDAFSGISANPLMSLIAKTVIQNGGAANLAETDELIGAEHFVISNVRDQETAKKFINTQKRYKEMASWHGVSAESNPSAGNVFRGLANIYLKSLGAAMKKHPDVCLDYVIDYAEPMSQPGFYFMDSPGNDPESVAGQVASGCNLVFFSTGNGSTMKFPFVPTIKIVTTTDRYRMMPDDMDVNAGKYLDGMPMDDLKDETLELMLKVASGEKTVGEKAHHKPQTQIWRGWRQSAPGGKPVDIELRNGKPVSIKKEEYPKVLENTKFTAIKSGNSYSTARIALIASTSLCSGGPAVAIAESLNKEFGSKYNVHFVGLLHTEGCGCGGSLKLFLRTLVGHAIHPNIVSALFLALGCEKTGISAFRKKMQNMGLITDNYGWVKIQSPGGLQKAEANIHEWFETALEKLDNPEYEEVSLENLCIGLTSVGELTEKESVELIKLVQFIVQDGGSVVVPQDTKLLEYIQKELIDGQVESSLAYGQVMKEKGFHIMANPSENITETITGLCSVGAHLILTYNTVHAIQSHPIAPVIQATHPRSDIADFDLIGATSSEMLKTILDVASRKVVPKLHKSRNFGFQIPRANIFSM